MPSLRFVLAPRGYFAFEPVALLCFRTSMCGIGASATIFLCVGVLRRRPYDKYTGKISKSQTEGSLREIRTLKNIYNKELNEQLEASLSSTSDSHLINLEDIMIHLHYNPVLRQIPDIQTRFWEQVIVDALINNNDRNNGNWGILYEEGKYKLAPVFDNGAAFYNKLPDSKLSEYLADAAKFQQSADMSRTVFALNGKPLMAKDLTLIENADFYETAAKLIPLIQSRLNEIAAFIHQIPEKYQDLPICSEARKQFYVQSIAYRLDNFLLPVYEKAIKTAKAL